MQPVWLYIHSSGPFLDTFWIKQHSGDKFHKCTKCDHPTTSPPCLKAHLKIHSVKPTRNNGERFQAFASISQVLREGFRKGNDKLILGVTSCKIYDRTQTKRCNNCQKFGHFMANCPTTGILSSGKCSGDHQTNSCTSLERGCVNCKRNNVEYKSHSAFYHKCPSLLKFEELLEEAKKTEHLNSDPLKHSKTSWSP